MVRSRALLRSGLFLILLVSSVSLDLHAHPYLMGFAELEVREGRLEVALRVVLLQPCLVGKVLADRESGRYPAEGLRRAVGEHGAYVLERLALVVGPNEALAQLQGKVVRIEEPNYADPPVFFEDLERLTVTYHLEFPCAVRPSRLLVVQRLMMDQAFTPGTSWQETVILRVRAGGRTVHEHVVLNPEEVKDLAIPSAAPGEALAAAPHAKAGPSEPAADPEPAVAAWPDWVSPAAGRVLVLLTLLGTLWAGAALRWRQLGRLGWTAED